MTRRPSHRLLPRGSKGGRAGSGRKSDATTQEAPGSTSQTPQDKREAALPASNTAPQTVDDDEEELDESASMSLTEHLNELRKRIARMLLGAAGGFLLCYNFAEKLFTFLAKPLTQVMPEGTHLIYTSVPEGFFVHLKVAFVAGIFIASPYIFYQLWAFIAPGLYKKERRVALPLACFSALFFTLGAAFCYIVVFPFAFKFFMSYSRDAIAAMPSLNAYLGFSLELLLAFGLIFEMPLFAFFLSRLGILTATWMRKMRRYAVLGIFIAAAILTPPDVFSQLLMAGPMLILYELSILVAAMARKRPKAPTDNALPSSKTWDAYREKPKKGGKARENGDIGVKDSAHSNTEPAMDSKTDSEAESALRDDPYDKPL